MPEEVPIIEQNRLEFQNILEEIFKIFREADGQQHVYYQPDTNTKLHYPCAIYVRDGEKSYNANNGRYIINWSYRVTIIDPDPISSCINAEHTRTIIDAISALPKSSYIRHFVNDNLNHDVFKIYYK